MNKIGSKGKEGRVLFERWESEREKMAEKKRENVFYVWNVRELNVLFF